MKVEHLTLMENSVVRDTTDILQETVDHFSSLEIRDIVKDNIKIDRLPFQLRVKARDGIAIFDIKNGNDVAYMNICCFDQSNKVPILLYLKEICKY